MGGLAWHTRIDTGRRSIIGEGQGNTEDAAKTISRALLVGGGGGGPPNMEPGEQIRPMPIRPHISVLRSNNPETNQVLA